jgi:hypothetical protein
MATGTGDDAALILPMRSQELNDSLVIRRLVWRKEHYVRSGLMLSELYNSLSAPLEAVRQRT